MKFFLFVIFLDGILAADLNFLNSTITHRFSVNRHHVANPTNKRDVRDFIQDQFIAYGFETTLQTFWSYAYNTNFTNVIGLKRGSNYNTAADRVVGIGAHYDTVEITPGVDDNGSAMAAMLHVMKDVAKMHYKNTMIFVAFDAEELEYKGSERFVDDWWAPFVKKSLSKNHAGFFILDCIMEYSASNGSQRLPPRFNQVFPSQATRIIADGNTGNFMASIYRNFGDCGDDVLANSFNTSWLSGGQTPEFKMYSFGIPTANFSVIENYFGDLTRSDHRNFWKADFPAIFVTDTANFRGKMQPCYHHPCDNLTVILTADNIRFLGKATDSLFASMDSLAIRVTETRDIIIHHNNVYSIGSLIIDVLSTT